MVSEEMKSTSTIQVLSLPKWAQNVALQDINQKIINSLRSLCGMAERHGFNFDMILAF